MYRAPVAEIAFTLKHVAGLGEARAAGAFPDLTEDVLDAVLAEAGRFATDAMAALDRPGDRAGVKLADGAVATAPGWQEVYRDWTAGGWAGIAAPEASGGQGLPILRLRRHAGDVERRLHGLRALPHADHGRGRGARKARDRCAEGPLSAAASSPASGRPR